MKFGHSNLGGSEPDGLPINARVPRSRLRTILCLGAAIVLCGAVLRFTWLRPNPPASVPIPTNLEKLDPQLKDYVRRQVKWVQEQPRDASRHATLGVVFAANQLWVEAWHAFSNVTRLSPKEPLGHLYLAVATQETGDYTEAARLFKEVATAFPRFAPAYDRLGTSLLKMGRWLEAEEAFRQLAALAPAEWRAYAGLGEAKLRLNQLEESARWLERARDLDPGSRQIRHLLGLAYRGLGRAMEAERELRMGINAEQTPMPDDWGMMAPHHVRLLPQQIELVSEYLKTGRPQEAIDALTPALQFHPDNLTLLEHLAVSFRNSGQPEPARRVAERMLSLNDKSVSAHVFMADICLDLGQNEQAMNHAEIALKLGPELPQSHLAKADVLFALGRNEEATTAREQALKKDPQNALIAVDVGDAYLEALNKPDQAKDYYLQALTLDPGLVVAYLRLAKVHIALGNTVEAQQAVQQARRLDPRAPDLKALESQSANPTESQTR